MKNALTTGDRLANWGCKGEVSCVFCRNGMESREHLFFSCRFSSRIWKEVMCRCNITSFSVVWDDVRRFGVKEWRKKSMAANICRLALSSTIYNLWRN
jgi:hypothetical protein